MRHFALLGGYGRYRLTVADPVRLMEALTEAGIELFSTVFEDEITLGVTVGYRDCSNMESICRKHGAQVKSLRRIQPPWKPFLHRWVLLSGLLMLFFLSLYVPSRVFFLEVEGNVRIPDRQILEVARRCGMEFGASRRQVRSETVKNALLEAMPELQWAGVNTRGCVAKISVRERPAETTLGQDSEFGHIVAILDGVITECTAMRGTLLCAPGEAVTQGQVLISGLTDGGLFVRAEQAQGEIYGRTRRTLTATIPQTAFSKGTIRKETKKISILFGKKRINLWKDSGISGTTCDRMYEEYYITLPGGFALPLGICVETFSHRETTERIWQESELQLILTQWGERYLKTQMTAGQILNSALVFEQERGSIRMTGEYLCLEMIGKMQRMEIGDYDGEKH
jgi:similar to stage IV sporulation protein